MRPRRGILSFLVVVLLLSTFIRVGIGTMAARAVTVSPAELQPKAVGTDCPAPPDALVSALVDREELLRTREAALAERLAVLDRAEQVLADRLAGLQQAEADLAATIAQADGAAERDVAALTAVYEAMKPKDAAALFEAMAPEFAAGFIARMRPDAAAEIMSGLSASGAYTISVLLAGRNAAAPVE